MTIAPPVCTCDESVFPSFGRPCPIHGSKGDAYREAAARLKAENDRLQAAIDNAYDNAQEFADDPAVALRCVVERLEPLVTPELNQERNSA